MHGLIEHRYVQINGLKPSMVKKVHEIEDFFFAYFLLISKEIYHLLKVSLFGGISSHTEGKLNGELYLY